MRNLEIHLFICGDGEEATIFLDVLDSITTIGLFY